MAALGQLAAGGPLDTEEEENGFKEATVLHPASAATPSNTSAERVRAIRRRDRRLDAGRNAGNR